jgi:predicted site-specific integrase-resolvase
MTTTEQEAPVKEMLTPKEAATMACLSQETLRRAEKAGKLAPLRSPGGHRRYRILDVENFIANRSVLTPAEPSYPKED